MPSYEIMLVVENAVTYTVEADSQEDAIEEAHEMFSPMDVDSAAYEITGVLVEKEPGSSYFVPR